MDNRSLSTNPFSFPIVDGHLDIAWNVRRGRDILKTASEVRSLEQRRTEQCMVTLPELERGGVAIVFTTVHAQAKEFVDDLPVYDPASETQVRDQLEVYQRLEDEGLVRVIHDLNSLHDHLAAWRHDRKVGMLLLMEGADPIGSAEDVDWWFERGLRMIGPAWSRTRHSGGTGRPGGLTSEGRELITAMKERGITLDASHLSEEAFWEALEIGVHRIVATHSNSRTLVDTDRQLSDEMVTAIGEAEGVVGLVLYNGFLDANWKEGKPQTSTDLVRNHAHHIAGLIGWERVGIGSDFDGGLGVAESPEGFETAADLWRVSEATPEDAAEGVLGANWIRFLEQAL